MHTQVIYKKDNIKKNIKKHSENVDTPRPLHQYKFDVDMKYMNI